MNRKIIALIIPAALLLGACSETGSPVGNPLETKTSLSTVAAGMFDLPSSVQAASPSVAVQPTQAALAKSSVAIDASDLSGFEAYQPVPAYIHLGESIKDSVRALIQALAAADLPESYTGEWDGMNVVLRNQDSILESNEGRIFWLTLRRDTALVMHLHYFINARSQIKGACYFKVEDSQAAVLVRFNTFNEGLLGKRLTIWVSVPDSSVNVGDPSILRLRAVETPRGRILVSGVSYHPNFDGDGFWSNEPKIYGFQAAANPQTGNAVLRVAFADAAEVDQDFYTTHSLDKAVLNQTAQLLRERMGTDPDMTKLAFYSLERGIPMTQVFTAEHILEYPSYTPSRGPETFTGADLEAFLDINAADIMAGGDQDLKNLYLYAKVKQPIFLSGEATIVGYDTVVPESMDLTSDDLTDVSPESTEDLSESEIAPEQIETIADDL